MLYRISQNHESKGTSVNSSDQQIKQGSETPIAKINYVKSPEKTNENPRYPGVKEINSEAEKLRKTSVESVVFQMTEKPDYFCSPTKIKILREKYLEYFVQLEERRFELVRKSNKDHLHIAVCEIHFDSNRKSKW